MKNLLEEHFEKIGNMSVPEYTLFRKWIEINEKKWTSRQKQRIWEIKQSIWEPKDIEDYAKIEPGVIVVSKKEDSLTWNILRIFTCTMTWNQNPGRFIRYVIYDKKTRKYLGVISLGSDFMALKPRDKYIGWTKKEKLEEKRLNSTVMGSSIVPTQPLGYNYVGGKLISLMVCSDKVVNAWNSRYKEPLSGITTTSLYGGFSQYTGLKHWKKCGTTEGKILLEPSVDVYVKMRNWIKEEKPEEYKKIFSGNVSHPKARMLTLIYKTLEVKPPHNNAPRGVYFCNLYNNTKDFLTCKSNKLDKSLFDNKVKTLTDLWKKKYASKRIKGLFTNNKVNMSTLFYDDMIGNSWEYVKEKYLKEVGR